MPAGQQKTDYANEPLFQTGTAMDATGPTGWGLDYQPQSNDDVTGTKAGNFRPLIQSSPIQQINISPQITSKVQSIGAAAAPPPRRH